MGEDREKARTDERDKLMRELVNYINDRDPHMRDIKITGWVKGLPHHFIIHDWYYRETENNPA